MKNLLIAAVLSLAATSAHASTLVCNTNVDSDPSLPNTSVTVSGNGTKANISIVVSGGIAMFVTAPQKFTADIGNEGPEMAVYANKDEQFELSVDFQPINGQITGTLSDNLFDHLDNAPVVCSER